MEDDGPSSLAGRLFTEVYGHNLDKGVLVPDGDHLLFIQDFRFASPSTAAGVLVGSAANGRTAWKTSDGKTLKVVQNENAEAVT